MSLIWAFIKNIFATLGSVLQILWQIVKFITSKCWKFILAIGAAILGLFITKKAVEKE